MPETIILTRQGPIGRLRLNRPAKLNAQTPQMWRELRELGRELRDDRDLRCLVVGGEGRAFSPGSTWARSRAVTGSRPQRVRARIT